MPLLTKKFTRDSLKRASGGGASIDNESEDPSKTEMIRSEMARVRAKSMRSRNSRIRHRHRHRSLPRGPSSPYRSFGLEDVKPKDDTILVDGGPTVPALSHPNDEYARACNEAEILTQMSSLTEPTWATSVAGGTEVNSTHYRHNQRNRAQNYNTVRLDLHPSYKW